MDFSGTNWWAVFTCVVIAMLSGFIWYHPALFFRPWWRGIGREGSGTGNPNPVIYVFTILAALVEAIAIAFLLNRLGVHTVGGGLAAGFMLWLGLVAPTSLVNKLFAGHGFTVWLIEAGNHLINLMLFGAILAAWR